MKVATITAAVAAIFIWVAVSLTNTTQTNTNTPFKSQPDTRPLSIGIDDEYGMPNTYNPQQQVKVETITEGSNIN